MKIKALIVATLAFLMAGCGKSENGSTASTPTAGNTTPTIDATKSFAYETQRSVSVNIDVTDDIRSAQRQILLFQSKHHDDVIDLDMLDELIVSAVISHDGHFSQTFTLGNHIQSIWILIPALEYEEKVTIKDNNINLTIGGH